MDIAEITRHQLEHMFLLTEEETCILKHGGVFAEAEEKTIQSLSGFTNKYFNGKINAFNGVMYCNFLYQLSRGVYRGGNTELADKLYSLNRMLHGVELFYEISLPAHWSCEHPLGAVMGRAQYGDYFFFYQGCTVGGSRHQGRLSYPTIGSHVMMYSNSKVLGRSHIGDYVTLSANAYVINEDIPDNCMVFGQSPNLIIKKRVHGSD